MITYGDNNDDDDCGGEDGGEDDGVCGDCGDDNFK